MNVLDVLRGGLIVSVQAEGGSELNTPETIALLCRVAVANGAVGVRVEGLSRIAAAVRAVSVPVIGLVKRSYEGFLPYITPSGRELAEIAAAGAAAAAFDATGRPRPDGRDVTAVVAEIHRRGLLAVADCAAAADVRAAAAAGCDALATTLCGYTDATREEPLPALGLVRACADTGRFAICEGGIGDPGALRAAFAAGADAAVVGTALTNVDALVRRFAAATPRAG
jgi:N-acylglucosamine-6-phosphate 2-epimerase